jgi:hypothetical protein
MSPRSNAIVYHDYSGSNIARTSRGYVGRHGVHKDALEGSEPHVRAAPKHRQQLESADFIISATDCRLKWEYI